MDFGNHLYSAFSSLVAVILHLAQELEVYDPKYISIFLYDSVVSGSCVLLSKPNQGRVMGFNRQPGKIGHYGFKVPYSPPHK
jgi:hypothetical protein